MCEKIRTQEPALARKRAAFEARYSGRRSLRALAALTLAAFFVGIASSAIAATDPPTVNRVFLGCTFKLADLRSALTLTNTQNKFAFSGTDIEASYIVIYVRANPSDGQKLATPTTPPFAFTGPVVCNNVDTDTIAPTSDTVPIPNPTNHGTATSIDILGSDETMEIQYQLLTAPPNPPTKGNIEKRVCMSAGPNVDCFFVQPSQP
ncbi:MAG TPA: hypothetical protein VFI76_02060 [Terrimicrobiaceae bacterium]|nr:hypothetical protein [Terrimicrobiaceae bacterium]